MTWWAAMLGFAGALAGSWGGQLIASRREDRRWQREREREDLRYEREMERLRLQHEREVDLAWRSERHASYAQLLTALLAFESKVYSPLKNPEVVADAAQREEVLRIHKEIHDAYTLVLVGSGSAVDKAGRRMILICKRIARWYELPAPSSGEELPDREALCRAFSGTFDDLTEACRNELKLGTRGGPPDLNLVRRRTESAN